MQQDGAECLTGGSDIRIVRPYQPFMSYCKAQLLPPCSFEFSSLSLFSRTIHWKIVETAYEKGAGNFTLGYFLLFTHIVNVLRQKERMTGG